MGGEMEWMDKNLGQKDPMKPYFMTSHRKPILNLEKCESFICGRKTFLYEKST